MAGFLSLFEQKKKVQPVITVVVVAAGSARRMEGIDKILVPLGELPALVHTLTVFEDCPAVNEVVVVTREDLLVEVSRLCRDYHMDKVTKVLVGGAERLQSVQNGLQEVRKDATHIAIHDGARPLLPMPVLEEVLARAVVTGAAAPALPLTDTVKRAENGLVAETVDRSALFGVQTPQVFDADLIRTATQKAIDDAAVLTDDCSAVERMGMKVSLTMGSRENIKLTTPFDLLVAEAILEARGRGEL
ncbi:MAG: 2-C-methyl-D-erythritol 4-phosphate cytidylyltransferase [Clostridium sp.]|nr:2-C-methyl-D-erythritol 4-phosphate cytidylyltransferase [Clostridium sp.]